MYGAAEFSRDIDFVLLLDSENLIQLNAFLNEIRAGLIAVPPLEVDFLERGHAVHFRCMAPGFEQLRIHFMARIRGADNFQKLWDRRSSAELLPGLQVDILSLPDLVIAKKTQRDKDWSMIRRLVDVNHFENRDKSPSAQRVLFWLQELRTSSLLVEVVRRWPEQATKALPLRMMVLQAALESDLDTIDQTLSEEQKRIRLEDKAYWEPLKKELHDLRQKRRTTKS